MDVMPTITCSGWRLLFQLDHFVKLALLHAIYQVRNNLTDLLQGLAAAARREEGGRGKARRASRATRRRHIFAAVT